MASKIIVRNPAILSGEHCSLRSLIATPEPGNRGPEGGELFSCPAGIVPLK